MRGKLLAVLVASGVVISAACGFDGLGELDPLATDPDAARTGSQDGDPKGGAEGSVSGGDASALDSQADVLVAPDAPPGFDAGCTDPLRCLKCTPPKIYCPSIGCVSDCKANCPGAPLGCVACQSGDTPSVETCVTDVNATSCVSGINVRCTCSGSNPSACPGSHQVCISGACRACGEPNTDGLKCVLPNMGCNAIDNPTDRFLCRPCSASQGCN